MNKIFLENDVIVLHTKTIIKLFSYKNWSDLVSLYLFYHKQCKIQETNQSFTVKEFVKQWLWWWDKRFADAKKILKELNLVEDVIDRDDKWVIKWWYVKLKYIISHTEANLSSGAETNSVGESTSGCQQTNAWSNKLEMLKVNNLNASEETTDSSSKDDSPVDDKEINNHLVVDKKINTNESNNKELVDDKRNTRDQASELYDYYVWKFPWKKWHARATAIDKILILFKKYSYEQLKLFVDIYVEDKITTLQKKEFTYIKTCDNFFWNVKWTKIKFVENFEWRELLSKPKQQVSTNNILDDKDNIDW